MITFAKPLRELFEGLDGFLITLKVFVDDVWDNVFPATATTENLDTWDKVFNLPDVGLSTQAQRNRLGVRWAMERGQSPSYIQNYIQDYGFTDVYIHEWWVPGSDPPVARSPYQYLADTEIACGEPGAECGEPGVECGEILFTAIGYYLVNKIYTASRDWTAACGEPLTECGEPLAECGEFDGFREDLVLPPLPGDEGHPYFLYFGGSVYGDLAEVPIERRDEFENLVLQLCPTQQWIGLLIDYVSPPPT
jgi:hypothetical protein